MDGEQPVIESVEPIYGPSPINAELYVAWNLGELMKSLALPYRFAEDSSYACLGSGLAQMQLDEFNRRMGFIGQGCHDRGETQPV